MSYTLRGRIESRLAATLAPLLAAAGLALAVRDWWPFALGLLMLGVGVILDVGPYNRYLRYQPGWAALPLGLLELTLLMGLVWLLGIEAPLAFALALFGGAWLLSQVLAHAGFPLVRLEYAEDGGELGRLGPAVAVIVLTVLATAGATAWATQPPTVYLSTGVHEGPLLLDHSQEVIGSTGTVVQGGIVITSSDVTVRGVDVQGGKHGIVVDGGMEGVSGIVLDDVHVRGAELDGIQVRRGQVRVRGCSIGALRSSHGQGIDISFAADLPPSLVEGCVVTGGQEGIFIDSTQALVRDNTVYGASLRGITVTEMSMSTVEGNRVEDSLGIGILCSDYSQCELENNTVLRTRPDYAAGNALRHGYGIVVNFNSMAELRDNHLDRGADGIKTFKEGTIRYD
jgi:parallel beta-helix repeat protein